MINLLLQTKTNLRTNILFFVFFLLQNSFLTAQDTTKARQIEQLFKELYETNQFNGSVLVKHQGHILHHKAYGYAHFDNKDTLQTSTPVRLASVSKQFTAVATLMLIEQGKLNLKDEIITYLPELKDGYGTQKITIEHLLRHSSGLIDYFVIDYAILNYYKNYENTLYNKDLLYYFRDTKPKLNFKPGRRVSYSNTGYVFLALIIERVSGMSYHSFIQKNIFDKLNMKDSFVYAIKNTETKIQQDTIVLRQDTIPVNNREIRVEKHIKIVTKLISIDKKRAYGFVLSSPYPEGFALLDYHKFDGMVGEKGICVSTNDFLKWDEGLRKNLLLKRETLYQAYQAEDDFGMGWKMYGSFLAYHHGLYRGFRTYMHRHLIDDNLVVILNNTQIGGKMIYILEALTKILEGKKYKLPKPNALEKNTLPLFKQKYQIIDNGKVMEK